MAHEKKLPAIRQLPSGSYRVQIYVGKDENGKSKVESYTDPDYDKVVLWALEMQKNREQSRADRTWGKRLGDCMDEYIAMKSSVLSPSTLREYRNIRRRNLQSLVNMRLENITQRDIQIAINKEALNHSPKSVRNYHGFLTAVLAVYRPEFHVKTTLPQKVKPDIEIPSDDDVKRMLSAAEGTPLELPIYLAACCGMRRSEICGLKWKDIDLKKGKIHIHDAIVLGTDGYVKKGTKTTASKRTISAFPAVLNVLTAKAEGKQSSDNVCELTPNQITSGFTKLLARAELRHIRFHDLRHYAVSTMLSLNIPKNYIADYVGHETEHMIDQVYGHIKANSKERFTEILNTYYSNLFGDSN